MFKPGERQNIKDYSHLINLQSTLFVRYLSTDEPDVENSTYFHFMAAIASEDSVSLLTESRVFILGRFCNILNICYRFLFGMYFFSFTPVFLQ